jgi:hypothetical protein
VAEAAAADTRARLVECAATDCSGLVAAAAEELGVDAAGWRRGRRGAVEVIRRDAPAGPGGSVTCPVGPGEGLEPGAVLVLDVGVAGEGPAAGGAWSAADAVVAVCRATVPGVRRVEALLTGGDHGVVAVAVVGPSRWPRVVAASCGPGLRAARRAGRVVAVPVHRQLEVSGLTAEPLPRPVATAGRALWALLNAAPSGIRMAEG